MLTQKITKAELLLIWPNNLVIQSYWNYWKSAERKQPINCIGVRRFELFSLTTLMNLKLDNNDFSGEVSSEIYTPVILVSIRQRSYQRNTSRNGKPC